LLNHSFRRSSDVVVTMMPIPGNSASTTRC
jgi:hypothetical protein